MYLYSSIYYNLSLKVSFKSVKFMTILKTARAIVLIINKWNYMKIKKYIVCMFMLYNFTYFSKNLIK